MKKIINIYLIIYTLPSCIVHQTCRSHHSQVKGLISTSNLTECITPFQHSLCIFCRNCKGFVSELHLADSIFLTILVQRYKLNFKFSHFFNNKCGSWPIFNVAVGRFSMWQLADFQCGSWPILDVTVFSLGFTSTLVSSNHSNICVGNKHLASISYCGFIVISRLL